MLDLLTSVSLRQLDVKCLCVLPHALNDRAPAQKKENLTLMDDHVLLVEYLEEHPLLLSRPGEEAISA